ncbi:hypothetical protein SEA_LITTLEFELLA_89 [Gordonia phage LittleFella]|nr:hypothetical protein SEA_LITTLEFELLA_89 [Gordonia phage LittleFella]
MKSAERLRELKDKHEGVKLDEEFGQLTFYRDALGVPVVGNGHEIHGWGIESARELYQDLHDLLEYHNNRMLNDDAGYPQMINDYEDL